MVRLTISLAALAIVLVGTTGFAVAAGGHHGSIGHHHHSGFSVHLGSGYGGHHSYYGGGLGYYGSGYGGLSSSYGHHHHYPSYGYSSYAYPRYYGSYSSYGHYPSSSYAPSYRTNSYYRNQPSCSPSVIYVQPTVRSYAPSQQPLDQQYQRPEIGPTPPAVPTENLPNPASTQRPLPVGQFTSLTGGQTGGPQPSSSVSPISIALKAAAPVDDLGPRLATPVGRRIVSDDESPWVVGASTFPEPDTSGKIAATNSSTTDR